MIPAKGLSEMTGKLTGPGTRVIDIGQFNANDYHYHCQILNWMTEDVMQSMQFHNNTKLAMATPVVTNDKRTT